jgi:hypothetical protein
LSLTNQGVVTANASGQTLDVNGGTMDNTAGTLAASNGGTLAVSAPLSAATYSGGTLTGNYSVDGTSGTVATLQLSALGSTGGEITTLGDGATKSSITLNGSNADTQFVDGGGKNALALGAVAAKASLTLENGYAMTTPGDLSNAGTVTIGGGAKPASLTVGAAGANTYTQTGATAVTQVDGTLQAATVTINSGLLDGNGTVKANVNNIGGTVKPGDPPGIMSIAGNYTQGSGGALDIEIGGLTGGIGAGHYSELLVGGTASLAGGLDLNLDNGFTLASGESFDVLGTGDGLTNGLTALDLDGAACTNTAVDTYQCTFGSFFDIFTEVTLDPGVLVPGLNPEDLVLDVTVVPMRVGPPPPPPVPEPGTLALFGTGLGALFAIRRRRKQAGLHAAPRA